MGTIFKYNSQFIQCQNLQKKLKKLKISEGDIEIIKDNIPNDILEKEFVEFTRENKNEEEDTSYTYYVFQNSKGYYLYNINMPNLDWYIKQFGFDISDYKLIDTCKQMKKEYRKWNPETRTGIKDLM